MRRLKDIAQKLLFGWMAGVMLVSSFLFVPQSAQAQFSIPALEAFEGFEFQGQVQEEAVQKPLGVALIQILLNLISFVANRLAYDAAIAIASGGKGQSANFEYRSIEEYGQDLWGDVLGESIGQLSEGLDVIGIEYNVCAPPDPLKTLNLQLGIAQGASRPEPTCSFREIQSNWEGFVVSLGEQADPNVLFEEFIAAHGRGQTELGATLTILTNTYAEAFRQDEIKTAELLQNDRFKDVEDFITGNVQTPSSVLQEQFQNKLEEAQGNQNEALQGALFGNEGALLQIGVSAGSVFLNTLLSQLTNKIYTGLFEPPTTGGVFDPDFINIRNRERARETFKGLLTTPIQTLDQYNVINQFVVCPGGTSRGPNNCVMDTDLASAITRAEAGEPLTIQGAIDAGMLHGDWPLISDQDPARNQDPFCYTYGYCYSNLVKMRIARVMPVGLELAAQKSGTGNLPVVTLQQAVDAFNDCNFDNPTQLLDANHPFCHLVDPNWVIKYPETQCRAQVYGQTLVSESADIRAQTCVDTPSCIAEDENGNCVGGYGYCTRERNVWRFDGDTCPAQYASCTTLTSRTGERDSLLTNTVDFADCDADNAGCRWYRTEQSLNDNATPADPSDDFFEWVDADPAAAFDVSSVRTYMNANAQTCSAGDAGCTALVRASVSPLNPVLNASFEQDRDEDGTPDFWTTDALVEYRTNGTDSAFGTDAVFIPEGFSVETKHPVKLSSNQFVTVSMHARAETALNGEVDMHVDLTDGTGASVVPTISINSPDCIISGVSVHLEEEVEDAYERFSCTFTTPGFDTWMTLNAGSVAGNVYIDGIQVDEQEVTSDFRVGYGPSSQSVHMRVAPSYLGCTGDASDPEACSGYAPVCAATEVGCTAYAPTNGDPTVPGIINETNLCPTECVGYDTYRQLETNFSQDVFPVYFIADSADLCTAEAEGCAEFTNLDALAEGGESLAYFTDVRACQELEEAGGTDAVYYTWEGSDAEGFQLRAWTLKQSNVGDAPCTSFDAASGSCTDSSSGAPVGCSVHDDIFLDPDCREFYDEDGDIHYRYYSDTITVDNACSPFRKTVSTALDCSASGGVWNGAAGNCTYNIMASESVQCRAADNGCRGYTGNTGNNTRIVTQEFFEDGNVNAWSGIPVAPTYSNESVAAGGHSMELNTGVKSVSSLEVVGEIQEGLSYVVSFWAKGSGELNVALTDVPATSAIAYFTEALTLGGGWQEYTFGPVDPSFISGFDFANATLQFGNNLPGTTAFVDNVTLREIQDTAYLIENSWVTPSTCDQTPDGVAAPQFFLGCQEYNTHRGDRVNLTGFASICREQAIGCEAFYDTQHSDSPYPQAFNLTCELGAVASGPTPCLFNGDEVCTVLDQQRSCTFTYEGLDMPDTLSGVTTEHSEIVTRDEKVYLVDLPQFRCSGQADGCSLYGAPVFSLDNSSVESFATAAVITDPDTYQQTLCEQGDLFCEAYSSDDGSAFYFKNPNNQKCEYSTGVSIEGTQYAGWFREGTSEPCYYEDANLNEVFDAADELGSSYLIGGTEFGIWRNGDTATYEGWVGTCPSEQNTCSEFVDVIDTADSLHPNGRPYYYLNNEKIDPSEDAPTETCDGLISQEEGCVGFNNNATPFTTFSASASYIKSWHADELVNADEPFTPVDPVDCSVEGAAAYTLANGITVDLCLSECAYPGLVGFNNGDPVEELILGGACMSDTDCGTITDTFGNDVQGTCIDHRGINTATGICLNAENSGALCNVDSDCVGATVVCELTGDASIAKNGTLGQANDANTILSVRRDRQCSEWLACDSQHTAWDEDQGTYVNVCGSVSLCNEFSALGNQSFCSNWVDEPQQLLTEELYANRDVTWYGADYAGYSVPGQYGVQDYDQVNINASNWCYDTHVERFLRADAVDTSYNVSSGLWSNGFPQACSINDDCVFLDHDGDGESDVTCREADEDYRLAVTLGACDIDATLGSACTVGSCTNTGLACSQDSECGDTETCDLTNASVGSCYNGQCAVTIDGNGLVFGQRQECRGYPEDNAPFPNDVVAQWNIDNPNSPLLPEDNVLQRQPSSYRSGFENVQTCGYGEVCECSYVTTEYGSSTKRIHTQLTRDVDDPTIPSGVCSGGLREGMECGSDIECRNNLADATQGGGTCQFQTTQNTFFGWNGFCIQNDLSINILASQDKHACLLWLPVDQLSGGTDIYNKFTEAGFSVANTSYCTEASLFADIGVTGAQILADGTFGDISPACAASFNSIDSPDGIAAEPGVIDLGRWIVTLIATAFTDGAQQSPGQPQASNPTSCSEGEWDGCWANVACPKNHFAIIGACTADANSCQSYPAGVTSGDNRNDCPFFCVPRGSRTEMETDAFGPAGTVCSPPDTHAAEYDDATGDLTVPISSWTDSIGLADMHHSFGTWNDQPLATEGPAQEHGYLLGVSDFNQALEDYGSCVVRGYAWEEDDPGDNTYLPLFPADVQTLANISNSMNFYLGCSELTFTSVEQGYASDSDSLFGNAAFTNRTLSPNIDEFFTLDETSPDLAALGYITQTNPAHVGRVVPSFALDAEDSDSLVNVSFDETDVAPVEVISCQQGAILSVPNQLLSESCASPSDLARAYDDVAYSLPAALANDTFACTEDSDCELYNPNEVSEPDGQCLTGIPNFACFLACDATALEANALAPPVVDGWDVSEGTAFCEQMGMGACIPDEFGVWPGASHVCALYLGHPQSDNPASPASQSLSTAQGGHCLNMLADSYYDPYIEWTDWINDQCSHLSDAQDFIVCAEGVSEVSLWRPEHPCVEGADGPNSRLNNMCDSHDHCVGGDPDPVCINGTCLAGDLSSYEASDVIPLRQADVSAENAPIERLKQFFARLYSVWEFEDQIDSVDQPGMTGRYQRNNSAPLEDIRAGGDDFGQDANDGIPTSPQVVNVSTVCESVNGQERCVEGEEGAFSVNGSDGRTWESNQTFLANVEFFAYPDENQFPLRKVIVDWGDGIDTNWASGMPNVTDPQAQVWGRGSESGSDANDNYYKAARGLDTDLTPICSPEPSEVTWGTTPDSCQERPFTFQHHYRCTPGMFAWLQAAGRTCERVIGTNTLVNSPCVEPGGNACVFQPRVYLEDNWGYCTGTCTGGADGGSACYGNSVSNGINNACDYELYPVIVDNDSDNNDPDNGFGEDDLEDIAIEPYWNPWINWNGVIEVTPHDAAVN